MLKFSKILTLNLPEYWWDLYRIHHRLWAASHWSILLGPWSHGRIVLGQHSLQVSSAQQSAVLWESSIWKSELDYSLPSIFPPSLDAISMNLPICLSALYLLILIIWTLICHIWASQVALVVKNPPTHTGYIRDMSSIPGLGGSPGRGHGNSLQYSCLENPKDRGAWWGIVHGVAKNRTRLSD